MKYFFLILIAMGGQVNSSYRDNCNTDFTIIKWNLKTKNRIDKVKIKDWGFNLEKVKIPQDSLSYYLSSLTPTKDTLFNIRMYCVIKCEGKRNELYFDWSGLIEYNGVNYLRNDKLTRFFLNHLPLENKEEYWPSWLE